MADTEPTNWLDSMSTQRDVDLNLTVVIISMLIQTEVT